MRILASLFAWLMTAPAAFAATQATLYRSPDCGCCLDYARYLKAEGFAVEVVATDDLADLKARHGVPDDLQACHTTLIGNYVVEGHVPATTLRRLLADKPRIAGIALPGMPAGSPGMGGTKTGPFSIYELNRRAALFSQE